MYVTRPLSLYSRSPEAANAPPPEGPNSGYLVVADEELNELAATSCCGVCKRDRVEGLPLPQDKILTVQYAQSLGQAVMVIDDYAVFIPVLDQPLSSNRYYVVMADEKHKGHACTCSKEAEKGTCCFCCKRIKDVKPRAFDHRDVYQQVEICKYRCGSFFAKSVAPDGIPPLFLRRKGWEIYASTPLSYQLGAANGIDHTLRMHLPNFNFPISNKHSPSTVVGKWYSPFAFIKEEGSLKDQMDSSLFYELHLERLWEEIHVCQNNGNEGKAVAVNSTIQRESAMVFGVDAHRDNITNVDGMMWFSGSLNRLGERKSVGLSMAIVDRMRWEALRGGWIDDNNREVRVEKVEEFGEKWKWSKFASYVLVEKFVLRRMDGSLVLEYCFRHTHVIQSKWE